MKTSAAARAAIFGFEGCRKQAYACPAGVPTIGVGHTRGVKLGQSCTDQQAQVWFSEDLEDAEAVVASLVQVPLSQGQFDAMVSFAYNLGPGNLKASTLLKYLNAGNYSAASAQFKLWCHAGGKVAEGLVKRRAWETDSFLKDSGGNSGKVAA